MKNAIKRRKNYLDWARRWEVQSSVRNWSIKLFLNLADFLQSTWRIWCWGICRFVLVFMVAEDIIKAWVGRDKCNLKLIYKCCTSQDLNSFSIIFFVFVLLLFRCHLSADVWCSEDLWFHDFLNTKFLIFLEFYENKHKNEINEYFLKKIWNIFMNRTPKIIQN